MSGAMLFRHLPLAALVSAAMIAGWPALRAAAAEGTFLAEIDDLPLAPGLVEQPGGTLFDSPQGRIVDATATGRVSVEEVRIFYAQTLPELGWQRIGGSEYRRDKEMLRIDFAAGGPPLVVHFALTPRAAAGQPAAKDADKNGEKQP